MDIRSLDLNLLKVLDALLDERSVTGASKKLGVTQPAASGMLTRLRESFDDPLFIRTQRGMAPTPRALELMTPVKRIIADAESLLVTSPFNPGNVAATITVAATDYSLKAVVVPFIAAMKPLAPHIRIAMVPIDSQLLLGQMEKGEIDIALGTTDMAPLDLHSRQLYDESYVCALREHHPVLQEGKLTLERFCHLDHALASYSGRVFHGVTDDALQALGQTRNVSVASKSFILLPELLLNTDMVAILPRRLVVGTPGLKLLPPPLPVSGFTKIAMWHERTHHSPIHQWLRSLLFEVCSQF